MAIDKAPKAPALEDRLRSLSDCFTAMLYKNVCRSLFEKHKLLFSFLLSVKIMQGEERMDSGELRFFLQGATSLDLVEPNPLANGEGWLSDKTWGEIIAAGKITTMAGFMENFKLNLISWQGVFVASDPLAEIESVVGDTYKPFQKLCLLRAIRPDIVVPGVQKFVAQVKAFLLDYLKRSVNHRRKHVPVQVLSILLGLVQIHSLGQKCPCSLCAVPLEFQRTILLRQTTFNNFLYGTT